ncbi:MAG: hypothetical protein CL917_15760 [Deltaproteobacteria bacterium]|nr:hypothetical protein [Deltaproteobacteria bacterium]
MKIRDARIKIGDHRPKPITSFLMGQTWDEAFGCRALRLTGRRKSGDLRSLIETGLLKQTRVSPLGESKATGVKVIQICRLL